MITLSANDRLRAAVNASRRLRQLICVRLHVGDEAERFEEWNEERRLRLIGRRRVSPPAIVAICPPNYFLAPVMERSLIYQTFHQSVSRNRPRGLLTRYR